MNNYELLVLSFEFHFFGSHTGSGKNEKMETLKAFFNHGDTENSQRHGGLAYADYFFVSDKKHRKTVFSEFYFVEDKTYI